jgi:putative oxidoreductase
MDVVFLIGRLLFVTVFIASGVMFHFMQYRQATQYAQMYNVPLAGPGVLLTGVLAVSGGVMIALGLWGDLGALFIVTFLLLVTPMMHRFWKETDPMQWQAQLTNFQKNNGLLGGALVIFYVFNQLQGDAGLCLTDPLFGKW